MFHNTYILCNAQIERRRQTEGVFNGLPADHLLLLLDWSRRARSIGYSESEFRAELDDIIQVYRISGVYLGVEHLRFATRLLREQTEAL